MCICAANYPLAKYSSVAREDSDKMLLILFDTTKPSFYTLKFQGEMIGGQNSSDLYFCESGITAMILAKAGYDVFFLPKLFAPSDDFLPQSP